MTKPKPGDFTATCRIPVPVPVQDLTDEQEKARFPTAVLVDGQWCAQVPCRFETVDAATFDAHIDGLHPKHAGGTSRRAVFSSWYTESRVTRPPRMTMWKPKRLSKDGVPFEPIGLEPGAEITWKEFVGTGVFRTGTRYDYETKRDIPFEAEEREEVERTGQVWCTGPYPKSAWVIPFEPLDDELGEVAVCVCQGKLSNDLRHCATWNSKGYRDAVA